MTALLQDKVHRLVDEYYAEQSLHRENKNRIAAERDFALSKAHGAVARDEARIVALQEAARAERERVAEEMGQSFQRSVLAARQQLAARLGSATARRKELDILQQKVPLEFREVKPASLESMQMPNSDHVYLDLLNAMYAYEKAPLIRRPDKKIKANKAAASFHAMVQAEMLAIEKTEQAAKDDLNLAAMQLQHDEELARALGAIDMHLDDKVDRSELAETERRADEMYRRQMSDEARRHEQQPTYEAVRVQCQQLIESELESLNIDSVSLAAPYMAPSEPRFEPVLFSTVADAEGFALELPYLSSWEAPEHLWLYVDDEEVQEAVLDWFRALVCENLRMLPPGMLRVLWIDPSQQGMTVRELAALAEDIPVCGAVVRRVTTTGQVNAVLSEIEELQAQIGEKTASYRGGIREYNERNPDDAIPFTMIVVNDITHPAYDGRAVGLLTQRMRNASNMGMQVLVLSDAYEIGSRDDEALDALRDRFFRTIAEVEGGSLFTQHASGELAQVKMLGSEFAEGAFIRSFVDACEEMARCPIERPEPMANLDEVPVYPASEGIEIPIGFYEDGSVASLKFGSVVGGAYAEHTHGIITGGTGSGKTTFVRNLIQSACSHYSPEELELWLVDYKIEMVELCNRSCRFPHFGLVGLDKSMDFVSGFMDYLSDEYERRARIMSEPSKRGAQLKRADISDYNAWAKANGEETLRRLLIIIDEFHVQATYMRQEPAWRTRFENLLREVRSRGMNILLVDQDIEGLSAGLTDSGKAQLSFRATLGINAGRTGDLRALFGSADNFADTISMAASMKHQALIHEKATNRVRLVAQTRDCDWGSISQAVVRSDESHPGQRIETKIYNVHDVEGLPLNAIVPTADHCYPVGSIPDFTTPSYEVQLRSDRPRQNVFAMGAADPLLPFNVISLMAYTAWRHHGYRVVVLGSEEGDVFNDTLDAWEELGEEHMDDQLEIVEGVRDINRFLEGLDRLEHSFVVIVGLDDLCAEMAGLPQRPGASAPAAAPRSKISKTRKLAALFAGEPAEEEEEVSAGASLVEEYNDVPRIYQLLTMPKKQDVHVAVVDDSFPLLRRIFRDERKQYEFDKMFPHAFATKPAALGGEFPPSMKAAARSVDDSELEAKIVYSDPSNRARSIVAYDVPWNKGLKG